MRASTDRESIHRMRRPDSRVKSLAELLVRTRPTLNCVTPGERRPEGARMPRPAAEHGARGRLRLPPRRAAWRPPGSRTRVPCMAASEPGRLLTGTVGQCGAVRLRPVSTRAEHGWWRELIGRYHYLAYRLPSAHSFATWRSPASRSRRWWRRCSSPRRRGGQDVSPLLPGFGAVVGEVFDAPDRAYYKRPTAVAFGSGLAHPNLRGRRLPAFRPRCHHAAGQEPIDSECLLTTGRGGG